MDSGLLIAPECPIVVVDSMVYPNGCSFDAFAAKSAVHAKTRGRRVAFSAFRDAVGREKWKDLAVMESCRRREESNCLPLFLLYRIHIFKEIVSHIGSKSPLGDIRTMKLGQYCVKIINCDFRTQ
jgi:hypothetical protein